MASSDGRPPSAVLVLHPDDNVAVALRDLARGETVAVPAPAPDGGAVIAAEPVPFGHKLALRPIARGAAVLKYGQPIGRALVDIAPGAWVHTHNLASPREGPRADARADGGVA
jgi:altronate hydrolase